MKLKLNILDWIVIGVLALAILFVSYQMFFAGQSLFGATEERVIVFQVETRQRSEAFRDAISARGEGDIAYLGVNERDEAEILDVVPRMAQVISFDHVNNAYITSIIPNYYDIIITLRSNVVATDHEFRNGSSLIRVGALMQVRGLGFATEGFIVDMWEYGLEHSSELFEDFNGDEEHAENGNNEGGEE